MQVLGIRVVRGLLATAGDPHTWGFWVVRGRSREPPLSLSGVAWRGAFFSQVYEDCGPEDSREPSEKHPVPSGLQIKSGY